MSHRPTTPSRLSLATRDHTDPVTDKLGRDMAMIADARQFVRHAPDERCATCALRAGTPANRSANTLLSVIKWVVDKNTFLCHEEGRKHIPCAGWQLLMKSREPAWLQAQRDFSDALKARQDAEYPAERDRKSRSEP